MPYPDRQPVASSKRWASLSLSLLIVALLGGCGRPDDIATSFQATPASSGAPTSGPQLIATPTVTPTISFYDPEFDPGPSPTFSPEKMTALAEYEADLQEERDHRATRAALPPGPVDEPFDPYTPEPLPTITTGLRSAEQCGDGPIESLQFWPNNCWTTYTDPGFLTVYAGLEYPFPETGDILGGVFVMMNTLDYLHPASSQVYWMPTRVGGVTIVQAVGMRLTVQADDGSHWIFDSVRRAWEQPVAGHAALAPASGPVSPAVASTTPTSTPTAVVHSCTLYPLAIPHTIVSTLSRGQEVELTLASNAHGRLGWLTWDSDQSIMALRASLTPPGTSILYRNPRAQDDRAVSVGDWVRGRAAVSEQAVPHDLLATFIGQTMTVPVWVEIVGVDSQVQYQIDGFVQMEVVKVNATPHRLSVRYRGPATCG